MTPTLKQQLDAILAACREGLALAEKATPGPWRDGTRNVWQDDFLIPVCEMRHRSYLDGGVTQLLVKTDRAEALQFDAAFIARARTLCPAALRSTIMAVEALRCYTEDESVMLSATATLQGVADDWKGAL